MSGLLIGLRIVLGSVLVSAAMPKIRQPYIFLDTIIKLELVGPFTARWIATSLPWIELLVGVCLLSRLLLSASMLATSFLAAVFVGVQWHVIASGLSVECGCFGSAPGQANLIDYGTFARSALMLAGAVLGFYICFVSERSSAPSRSIVRNVGNVLSTQQIPSAAT